MIAFFVIVLAVVAGNLVYDIGNDIFDSILSNKDEDDGGGR